MPTCNQAGCTVQADGKCLEGLIPPSKCTHYSDASPVDERPNPDDEMSTDSGIEASGANNTPQFENFYSGQELNTNECQAIMTKYATTFVLIAGLQDSGKTTTAVTLFNQFLRGPFANLTFSGSKTLLGFEARSHLSRAVSQALEEDTVRTPLGEGSFLHLNLYSHQNKTRSNILVSDLSGEQFSILRNSSAECKKFLIAPRADHFCLFFDSKAISEGTNRHAIKAATLGVLRSLLETNMLSPCVKLQLVFSKWDLISAEIQAAEPDNSIFREIEKEVKRKWPMIDVSVHRISSRPNPASNLPVAFGLAPLINLWAQPVSNRDVQEAIADDGSKPLDEIREFLKYKSK